MLRDAPDGLPLAVNTAGPHQGGLWSCGVGRPLTRPLGRPRAWRRAPRPPPRGSVVAATSRRGALLVQQRAAARTFCTAHKALNCVPVLPPSGASLGYATSISTEGRLRRILRSVCAHGCSHGSPPTSADMPSIPSKSGGSSTTSSSRQNRAAASGYGQLQQYAERLNARDRRARGKLHLRRHSVVRLPAPTSC